MNPTNDDLDRGDIILDFSPQENITPLEAVWCAAVLDIHVYEWHVAAKMIREHDLHRHFSIRQEP